MEQIDEMGDIVVEQIETNEFGWLSEILISRYLEVFYSAGI